MQLPEPPIGFRQLKLAELIREELVEMGHMGHAEELEYQLPEYIPEDLALAIEKWLTANGWEPR